MKRVLITALALIFVIWLLPAAAFAQETLPTTSPFGFWWEKTIFNIKTAFTFNAERKAELLQSRLDKLDEKAEACTENEDEECLEKIAERQEKLEQRTASFLEKREELKNRLIDKFEQKKKGRAEHRENLKGKLEEKNKNKNKNAEHLIEIRSKNLNKALDKTRGQTKIYQENINRHFEENGSTVDVQLNSKTETSAEAEVSNEVKVEVNVD